MRIQLLALIFAGCYLAFVPKLIRSQHVNPEVLREQEASRFAALALKCVAREYPNKPEHVVNDEADVRSPKLLHAAFYGCYDWHSSVHGHWMLVRLLKRFPSLPEGPRIRTALNASLTAPNIAAEVTYMQQPNRQSFERTYGWAWLLKLAEELNGWNDNDGKVWANNLKPLAAQISKAYMSFLPKQNYPIRTGVHPNTAFGLAFAFDYANTAGDEPLKQLLIERSRSYFVNDKDYPGNWEPGGEDFFSPALMEADLMRRVLKPAEFATWFHAFLPGIVRGNPTALLEPAVVTDRTDPKLVHLDGLNLSRAWCLRNIAAALASDDPIRSVLMTAADKHVTAGLSHVASGEYAGEHWLASFAVYLLFPHEK
ncbi:MAG TPA: DUF2891 domain-containing protein [Pyrinomonadaceae bacterium]